MAFKSNRRPAPDTAPPSEERVMNDKERQMLEEMHAAFFSVPPGSPDDEKPLIEKIRVITKGYERASWVTRFLVYGIPAMAGVAIGIERLSVWWDKVRGLGP